MSAIKSVQRGTVAVGTTNKGSKSITITEVDMDKTFLNVHPFGKGSSTYVGVYATLTSSTTVQLNFPTSMDINIAYEVVEFY